MSHHVVPMFDVGMTDEGCLAIGGEDTHMRGVGGLGGRKDEGGFYLC